MSSTYHRFGRKAFPKFLASAVIFCGAPAIAEEPAGSPQPTTQQLLERVQQLESEVKSLKAQMTAAPQTQPTASEFPQSSARAAESQVRATESEVLQDAERRSQLSLSESIITNYRADKGFVLQSEDGNFLLHPWAFFQFRDVTQYREKPAEGGGPDWQNGFEMRRLKLILDGNVFTPDITYQIIWGTDRTTGNLVLEDGWGRYHIHGTDLAVRAGQIRDPFDHEQIVYGTRMLATERSIVDNVFANGDGIVQGVSLGYGYDKGTSPIRTEVAFTDGMRSANTNFLDFPTNTTDWGMAGRLEYKLMGNWADYSDFTAFRDKTSLLVVGGGMDYTHAGDTGAFMHVVDVQYENPDGLSAFAAYLGRYTANNGGAPGTNGGSTVANFGDTYDATVRLQAGWIFDNRWEPFARYEYLHFDSKELPATAVHNFANAFALGMNYYVYSYRLKLTGDVVYLPTGLPITDSASDILATSGGAQVVIRVQVQLVL